jgi:hypothetical protein
MFSIELFGKRGKEAKISKIEEAGVKALCCT